MEQMDHPRRSQKCKPSRAFGAGRLRCLRVVLANHAGSAGRQAKAAFAWHDRLGKIRCGVGDVMIEPQCAVRMIGEIRDNVAATDFYHAVLHELGLDKEIGINRLELGDERAAHEPVKVRAGHQPHARMTSSTGVKGRLNAVATPGWVTWPSKVFSPLASAVLRASARGKLRSAISKP